jgi:hypothetical protein
MLSLVCLVLITLPQDDAKITVTKVRPTLVDLGPTRADASYLPGDVMHVTFDVSGFKLDNEGRYRFSAKLNVEDSAGKLLGSEDYGFSPARLGAIGGGKSRFSFRLAIPTDQGAGNYKAKLILGDFVGKSSVTVEQAYKVLPASFGLIRLQTGRGPLGQTETPSTGSVGEVLYLGLQAVGLAKGKEDKGTLEVTLEVQDSTGKVLSKPQTSTFNDIVTTEPLQLRFELPLDQAGKYQVVFKATDKTSNKTSSMTVPVMVID